MGWFILATVVVAFFNADTVVGSVSDITISPYGGGGKGGGPFLNTDILVDDIRGTIYEWMSVASCG